MMQFKLGQRVRVHRVRSRIDGELLTIDATGTVTRLRRLDKGAFVKLDFRNATRGVHGFPTGDTRDRDVLAYPENCDPVSESN